MIPFLKKNKDGKKPPKPTVPHTAQESIPFQRMFEDGTCRVRPGYYTRTIQYQDINYQLAQQEDKTAIFEEWCSFLNFFDSSIHFELSFVNTATDSADFEKSIRIPYQHSKTGGIAVLKGNLAPDTAVVKRSAVVPEMQVHEGPARVFDCEEDAIAATPYP